VFVIWLLHIVHLFIRIAFPIWARKLTEKRTKIILHIAEITGAAIICSLAPIIYISVSDSKYRFRIFPPLLCFPSSEVYFYTICLPLCLVIGTGVILAIFMFRILHKVSRCSIRIHVRMLERLVIDIAFI